MVDYLVDPKISVIIPVYNKEKYVGRAIESVLDQGAIDLELIVVCDPSKDNSTAEVEKFKDPRIRVFCRDKPGPGGYAARNLGVEVARGEWVAFLDADDEYLPGYLPYLSKLLADINSDVVLCSHRKVEKEVVVDRRPPSDCVDSFVSLIDALRFLYKRSIVNTNSIVIRRSVLLACGLFPTNKNYRRGGDVDTWLRSFVSSRSIYCSGTLSSIYHVDNSGVVKDDRNANGCLPVSDTVCKLLKNPNLSVFVKKELKKLSNVKVCSMIFSQAKKGVLSLRLAKRIYWREMSIKQTLKLAILFVFYPYWILKSVLYR